MKKENVWANLADREEQVFRCVRAAGTYGECPGGRNAH